MNDQVKFVKTVSTVKTKAELIEEYKFINVDDSWYDMAIEHWTEVLNEIGFHSVEIRFRGFWTQGDGASFTGNFHRTRKSQVDLSNTRDTFRDIVKSYLADLDRYAFDMGKVLNKVHKLKGTDKAKANLEYGVYVVRGSSLYCHEKTVYVDDDTIEVHGLRPESDTDDFKECMTELVEYLSKNIYEYLETEHSYLLSDEAVWEALEANEMFGWEPLESPEADNVSTESHV